MKFVLASHNKGKLAEMQAVLADLGIEVVMPADLGIYVDVEETGETFAENAALKANAIMEASGLLLQNLRGATDRSAYFHTAIVCAFPNGDMLTAEGDCHGAIAFAPMGDGGFGYDPVFLVPSLRRTFAQLTAEEKNAISHRGNALRKFAAELKEYLANNEHLEK